MNIEDRNNLAKVRYERAEELLKTANIDTLYSNAHIKYCQLSLLLHFLRSHHTRT